MRLSGLMVIGGVVAVLGGAGAVVVHESGLRPVQIASGSMGPTVQNGDWVVVEDLDGDGREEVERGDIVMFRFPLGTSGRAIKRVIAEAGDTVAIGPDHVTVNGHTTAIAGAPSEYAAHPRTEYVPPGHAFLLGDNPRHSVDSRSFGSVPEEELVARHVRTLGPTRSLLGTASGAVAVFALVLIVAVSARRRANPNVPFRSETPRVGTPDPGATSDGSAPVRRGAGRPDSPGHLSTSTPQEPRAQTGLREGTG